MGSSTRGGPGEDSAEAGFELVSQRVGAFPLVNHFLARTGLPALLERYLPSDDGRYHLEPATAVALVVANLLLGREPLYGLGEWAARFDPVLLGLAPAEVELLNDDRVGRALERLFDADRASLLTQLLLGVAPSSALTPASCTTTPRRSAYPESTPTRAARRAGKPTPVITFGHSKDPARISSSWCSS